jgi:curved DNA-binding protein
MKNFYDILNISPTASEDEIKKAYRKLASFYHPDKGGTTEKFQEIEEAYRILSDPQKRQQYDHSSSHNRVSLEDIFTNFAVNSGININDLHHIFNRTRRSTFKSIITLTLEEAYYGTNRNIKLDTHNGPQYISIDIPPGIDNNMQMKYDNISPNFQLIVNFQLLNHPLFRKIDSGPNLEYIYKISVFDLIVGTEIRINTINNKELTINIPPKTNTDTVFRIPEYGMRIHNTTNCGDLMLKLVSYIPENIDENIIQSIRTYK